MWHQAFSCFFPSYCAVNSLKYTTNGHFVFLFFRRALLMGGGQKYPPGITRLLDEIETKFQLLPHISMTAIPMELPENLSDATGTGKSKMAASKLKIRISQFVNKITTIFQRLDSYMFSGPIYPIGIMARLHEQTGRNKEAENPIWRPLNFKTRKSQFVRKIATIFQRLRMFSGSPLATQLRLNLSRPNGIGSEHPVFPAWWSPLKNIYQRQLTCVRHLYNTMGLSKI